MDEWMDELMGRWIGRWMNRWMDVDVNFFILQYNSLISLLFIFKKLILKNFQKKFFELFIRFIRFFSESFKCFFQKNYSEND